MNFQILKSPIGKLYLVADDSKLQALIFESFWQEHEKRYQAIKEKSNKLLETCKKQLDEYFDHKRKSFDLPYDLQGTPFQIRTWSALTQIPYGQFRSYKEIARLIGAPKATRAIGRTNGINPLCIIIPCHRVIGSDGSLTGYAGGLTSKKFLLDLEKFEN